MSSYVQVFHAIIMISTAKKDQLNRLIALAFIILANIPVSDLNWVCWFSVVCSSQRFNSEVCTMHCYLVNCLISLNKLRAIPITFHNRCSSLNFKILYNIHQLLIESTINL